VPSRKHSWTRDEVVLALELYLREGVVGLGSCRSLSEELRSLPVEQHLAVDPSFRNTQSVRSKLYNLQWLDTDGVRGRPNAGAQTVATWEYFGGDALRVETEAREIRHALADAQHREEVVEDDDYEVDESAVKVVAHRRRERDQGLVRRKRLQVLRRNGALACEACSFDSQAEWGIAGIIECHHLVPVSELEPGRKTKLADTRLLCPNCHRLVHSRRPWLKWDELLSLVQHENHG
jgi:5-methylcytosine-specific restriction enzyme A